MNSEKVKDRKLYQERRRYHRRVTRRNIVSLTHARKVLLFLIMTNLGMRQIPGIGGDKPCFRRISPFGL